MCDYIYLDGLSATLDNDLLYWSIDERCLTNKKPNQKIFITVQQIRFTGSQSDPVSTVDGVSNDTAELITNLKLKNSYNTVGRYNVLSMCNISFYDDGANPNIRTIVPNACDTNSYLRYEIYNFDYIQLGLLYLNKLIQFSKSNNNLNYNDKAFFKCLIKFEYEDK